jgi:hypothetical protein
MSLYNWHPFFTAATAALAAARRVSGSISFTFYSEEISWLVNDVI